MAVQAGRCYALKAAADSDWAAVAVANGGDPDAPWYFEALSGCNSRGEFRARELRALPHLLPAQHQRATRLGAGAFDLFRTEVISTQSQRSVLHAVRVFGALEWSWLGFDAAAWEPEEPWFVSRFRRAGTRPAPEPSAHSGALL